MEGMQTLPPVSEMERAWLRRDASYDGLFFLAVRTTGIYCRPHCPARQPDPRNVRYFGSTAEAEAEGFRACKRCHPLEQDGRPTWARSLMEEVERAPDRAWSEAAIRALGVDPSTARRWFQRRFGLSFTAWARARRLDSARGALGAGGRVDDAVFDSGYDSHSGFREAFTRVFGAPPGRARQGLHRVHLGGEPARSVGDCRHYRGNLLARIWGSGAIASSDRTTQARVALAGGAGPQRASATVGA